MVVALWGLSSGCGHEPFVQFPSFDTWTITPKQGKVLTASQIVRHIKDAREHGYTLKSVEIEDVSFAKVTGTGSDLKITLLKVGNFTANIVLEHDSYGEVSLKNSKFIVTVPKFGFTKLARSSRHGKTVTASQVFDQIPNPEAHNYALKSVEIDDVSFAKVSGTGSELKITLLKAGNFTADIVLKHDSYFDVTVKGAAFEVVAPDFSFTPLVRSFTDGLGKAVTTSQLLKQLPNAKSQGYKLKSISLKDGSHARVAGVVPNLRLEILKLGNFTADIVLEHDNYFDVMVKGAAFEIRALDFSFTPLVRSVTDGLGKTITTSQLLMQLPNAKSQGYKLKGINLKDGSHARVAGVAPNLRLEILKLGNFTADIVLEHDSYFDVTIKGAAFEIRALDFSFTPLVRSVTDGLGKTITTSQLLTQLPNAKSQGYKLKGINLKDGSYAQVTGVAPNLKLEILKAGNFTADIVLEHDSYFDVTIKGATFEAILPSFRFIPLVHSVTTDGGEKITTSQLLTQLPNAKSQGYKLKGINLKDGSYAQVTGVAPNLGLEILKAGKFTADIILEHSNYLDVTVRGAKFVVVVDRTYGGSKDDRAYSIIESRDGSIWVAGSTKSKGSGGSDMWILRLNKAGKVLLDKTYGGSSLEEAKSITESSDGNIWVAGHTWSKGSGQKDMWILKLSKDGSVLLDKTYGGSRSDGAESIIESSDGSIWVAGVNENSGQKDMWILKLSKDGSILLDKTHAGTGDGSARSIIESSDGSIWVAGYIRSKSSGYYDMSILRLNKTGKVLLEKTYDGGAGGHDHAYSITESSDGSIWVAGDTESKAWNRNDMWILKLSKDGSILLDKTYGGKYADSARSIIGSRDGSIWVVGDKKSKVSGRYDMWILRLSGAGSLLLDKIYEGNFWDEDRGIMESSDGSIWVAGENNSKGSGGYDAWILGGINE